LGYVVAVAFNEVLPGAIEGSAVAAQTPSDAPAATAAAAGMAVPADAVPSGPDPTADVEPDTPPVVSDISADEVLAFEATMELAPAMLTVTAAIDATADQLRDLFNGNDW